MPFSLLQFETLIFDGLPLVEMRPEDKQFLESFKECRHLSLIGCRLRSLANMPMMTNVTRLDLAENCLISNSAKKDLLASIPINFKYLQHLNLANNSLDMDSMKSTLVKLGDTLTKLDLSGNPVTHHVNYRETLFELVPSLQFIDGLDREGRIKDFYEEDGSDVDATSAKVKNGDLVKQDLEEEEDEDDDFDDSDPQSDEDLVEEDEDDDQVVEEEEFYIEEDEEVSRGGKQADEVDSEDEEDDDDDDTSHVFGHK